MTEPELIEYTGKIWDKFLNDLGVNLDKLQELQEQEGEKKKVTFDDLFQTCVGEIGIDPIAFWQMTYKETVLAIRGYENRQEREWQRIRVVAYQVYASTPTKDSKKPIHSYLPLPSDRIKRRSKEEMEAVRQIFIQKQRKQNEKLKLKPD